MKVEIEIETLVAAHFALKRELPRNRKHWAEAKNGQTWINV